MAKILKKPKKSLFGDPGLSRGGGFTSTPRGGALSPAGVRSPGTARRDKSLQAAAGLERAG